MRRPTVKSLPGLTDADDEFQFTVEQEHVRGSVVADPENCAGACALKALPGVKNAWVLRTRTILEFEDGKALRWENPKSLQRKVEQFDTTAGLFPAGTYRLKPLCQAQRAKHNVGRPHTDDGTRPQFKRSRPAYALR